MAGLVGPSVPLVFVIAFAGVGAVAYGFVRLTSYFNHAGSIYGLVGITVGPRAGFFGGWALLGTYVFFAACTMASCGVFLEAFFVQAGFGSGPPWLLVALIGAAVVLALNIRESAVAANVLLLIGGIGIAAMLVLAAVIFGRAATGSAPKRTDHRRGQYLHPRRHPVRDADGGVGVRLPVLGRLRVLLVAR